MVACWTRAWVVRPGVPDSGRRSLRLAGLAVLRSVRGVFSVGVAHVLVGRVAASYRRDAVSPGFRTGDAAIPVVVI